MTINITKSLIRSPALLREEESTAQLAYTSSIPALTDHAKKSDESKSQQAKVTKPCRVVAGLASPPMRLPIKAGVGVQAGSVVVHIAPCSTLGLAVALTVAHSAHVAVALAALQLACGFARLSSQPIWMASFAGPGRLQPAIV